MTNHTNPSQYSTPNDLNRFSRFFYECLKWGKGKELTKFRKKVYEGVIGVIPVYLLSMIQIVALTEDFVVSSFAILFYALFVLFIFHTAAQASDWFTQQTPKRDIGKLIFKGLVLNVLIAGIMWAVDHFLEFSVRTIIIMFCLALVPVFVNPRVFSLKS